MTPVLELTLVPGIADPRAIAVGRHTREPAEGGCEMALIRKSASQGNLRDLQVATTQERLRPGDADAPYIFADGAAEMAMELAADLDGMPARRT